MEQKQNQTHDLIDYIQYNIIKDTKILSIGYLAQIDELLAEFKEFLPADYDINYKKVLIRKKILDNMNNSIRQTQDSIREIKKIL